MPDPSEPNHTDLLRTVGLVSEIRDDVLISYARLWQLETWLRQMVYVELRSAYGDRWEDKVIPGLAENARAADSRLRHMPTPERHLLSYMTFGSLCKTIEAEWRLFETYLPPRTLWLAKLEEIQQIRHRVAHFRVGHRDDLDRVLQFLRDLDPGFWQFCTSYNGGSPVLPYTVDPVINHFLPLEQYPYCPTGGGGWVKLGAVDPSAALTVSIEAIRRSWRTECAVGAVAGEPGYLYDVHLFARDQRCFAAGDFLASTRSLHDRIVHLMLADYECRHLRVTIPAVIGQSDSIDLITKFVDAARHRFRSLGPTDREPLSDGSLTQAVADEWPEHVLGPKHPLAFLDPGMPCSFFNA